MQCAALLSLGLLASITEARTPSGADIIRDFRKNMALARLLCKQS